MVIIGPRLGIVSYPLAAAPPDPLAGLTLGMRLQTHMPGTGEVQLGLYKDVLCTDPVTEEGDVVAGVKDEIGSLGIMAVQATLAARPMALLDEDGNWVMDFDAIDDWLVWNVGSKGGQITYTALFRSNVSPFNNFWALLDNSGASSAPATWAPFENGQTRFLTPFAAAVEREGIPLASPFDSIAPITDLISVTVTTQNSTSVARGIGQLEQTYFGNFQLVALIVHEAADKALVQSYIQTLK